MHIYIYTHILTYKYVHTYVYIHTSNSRRETQSNVNEIPFLLQNRPDQKVLSQIQDRKCSLKQCSLHMYANSWSGHAPRHTRLFHFAIYMSMRVCVCDTHTHTTHIKTQSKREGSLRYSGRKINMHSCTQIPFSFTAIPSGALILSTNIPNRRRIVLHFT